MPSLSRAVLGAASVAAVGQALSLSDVCTTAYATAALPAADFLPGITLNASSVTTARVTNSTASNDWYITETISYCNVTISYSHNGIPDDLVHVSFWVPEPDKFENRYVTTGGSGLSINAVSLPRSGSYRNRLLTPVSANRARSQTLPASSLAPSQATQTVVSAPLIPLGTRSSSLLITPSTGSPST